MIANAPKKAPPPETAPPDKRTINTAIQKITPRQENISLILLLFESF